MPTQTATLTPSKRPVTSRELLTPGLRPYFFSWSLAFRLVASGKLREGLRMLVAPLRYWRFWPNALVVSHVTGSPRALRILDVSSPKLLALYLAASENCSVIATDLDDPKLMSRWLPFSRLSGRSRFDAEYQDARHLRYPDGSFDLVYSISVIEHIPGEGDAEALQEFCRVLVPGGTLIVEVPYRRRRQDFWLSYDSKGAPLAAPQFYERHYDGESLVQRLRAPGLVLAQAVIQGEWLRIDPWIAHQNRLPRALRWCIMPFEPLLAILNMYLSHEEGPGHPLAAILVFRKQPE